MGDLASVEHVYCVTACVNQLCEQPHNDAIYDHLIACFYSLDMPHAEPPALLIWYNIRRYLLKNPAKGDICLLCIDIWPCFGAYYLADVTGVAFIY